MRLILPSHLPQPNHMENTEALLISYNPIPSICKEHLIQATSNHNNYQYSLYASHTTQYPDVPDTIS